MVTCSRTQRNYRNIGECKPGSNYCLYSNWYHYCKWLYNHCNYYYY